MIVFLHLCNLITRLQQSEVNLSTVPTLTREESHLANHHPQPGTRSWILAALCLLNQRSYIPQTANPEQTLAPGLQTYLRQMLSKAEKPNYSVPDTVS